ncbi:Bug family tripartite tricarboxylate transporter substrate binding protein [Plastoroseomonas arctica]|uniref:Tripartite tricarboxylate transporter substrate binding protein n=1 Tax=Plastoroseomonas arctica TaxID=1509237 RepID=A0AAF1KJV7_9PROT|nr:tripartite tricarboxylate transporter substrate-binding protein [Plastoroseomonas arctica]MBR0655905.1 tripartite tricarboxylate transporter substrate binding protein [Plastoroseomonas arctica]
MKRRVLMGAAGAMLAAPALRAQQAWPTRPVRIIVPSVTGGFDIYARMMAQQLSEMWRQPVVVDNRPGANGNIGMSEVQRATDGHTLLFAAVGSLSINISVFRAMPLDPIEDLAPVALSVTSPMIWVANPQSRIHALADIITEARARPGQLNYALPSSGTINHLIVEAFKQKHNLDMPAVPYRGTAPAQLDVVSGQVPLMVDSLGAGWGHISSGRMRALALTSRERSPRIPELATAIELGLEDREYVAWYAYMAPKTTPPEILARMNASLNQVAMGAEIGERLRTMGSAPAAMTPEAQLAFMRSERALWGGIARAGNIEAV